MKLEKLSSYSQNSVSSDSSVFRISEKDIKDGGVNRDNYNLDGFLVYDAKTN